METKLTPQGIQWTIGTCTWELRLSDVLIFGERVFTEGSAPAPDGCRDEPRREGRELWPLPAGTQR